MPALSPDISESALSAEERSSVLAELDAVLEGPQFSGSKRCKEFLNFVVRRALEGNFEQLTERFVGAELFNRPIDYETSSDAIVRVKACEVRKRLFRHNSDHSSGGEVQIKLSAGSYVPEFVWAASSAMAPLTPTEVFVDHEATTTVVLPPLETRKRFVSPVAYAIAASVVLFALIGSGLLIRSHRSGNSALNSFWKPVYSGTGTVDIRFGDGAGSSYWISPALMHDLVTHKSLTITSDEVIQNEGNQASSGNFLAAVSVISHLERHGVPTEIQWPQDFRGATTEPRSVVYIGAFSNPWTLQLNRNLRFSFDAVPVGAVSTNGIVDHAVPHQQWPSSSDTSSLRIKDIPMHRSFALITRIFDEDHRHVVMTAGGLNQYATQAAGEFLSDPDAWSNFARTAPRGWEGKNLQIVLEMDVLRGRVVDPRIVATNVW